MYCTEALCMQLWVRSAGQNWNFEGVPYAKLPKSQTSL